MKPLFFLLPILSFFIVLTGTIIGSNTEYNYLNTVALSLAAFLVILWIKLDFDNLKKIISKKSMKYGMSSGTILIVVISIVTAIVILSYRPRFQFKLDVTESQINTLSSQTKKIIENIATQNKKIEIIGFFRSETSQSQFKNLIDSYVLSGFPASIEYLDIQEEPVRAMAENVTSANTVIFRYQGIESRVSIFNEEKITNAIIKVIKGKAKKVYFLTGHGESRLDSDENSGFSFVDRMLKNDNYETANLSLSTEIGIPNDADLIVLAGSKYDINEFELNRLEKYLKDGGDLFLAIDAVIDVPNILSLAKKFGIEINEDLVLLSPDDTRAKHYGQNNAFITDFDGFHLITKDFAQQNQVDLILPFTRSLSVVEDNELKMKTQLIAKSSSEMIKINNVKNKDDLGDIVESRVDTSGSYSIMAVATGNENTNEIVKIEQKTIDKSPDVNIDQLVKRNETRFVVVGTSSFLKNQIIQSSVVSQDLFMNTINYLTQDEEFISIRPKETEFSTISVSTKQSQIVLLLICLLYPLSFLALGSILWLRRRNA